MLWSFLSLCFFHVATPAAQAVFAPHHSAGDKSVIAWTTEKEHDFGTIAQGRPRLFVFKFQNVDADTILLQTVRTSCGCTAANWTETPIAPGENGEVRIEYDAYQGGAFDKKIRVFFDRQRKPEILRIRGTVE